MLTAVAPKALHCFTHKLFLEVAYAYLLRQRTEKESMVLEIGRDKTLQNFWA